MIQNLRFRILDRDSASILGIPKTGPSPTGQIHFSMLIALDAEDIAMVIHTEGEVVFIKDGGTGDGSSLEKMAATVDNAIKTINVIWAISWNTFTICTVGTITNMLKFYVGRPRPNMYSVCGNNATLSSCQGVPKDQRDDVFASCTLELVGVLSFLDLFASFSSGLLGEIIFLLSIFGIPFLNYTTILPQYSL